MCSVTGPKEAGSRKQVRACVCKLKKRGLADSGKGPPRSVPYLLTVPASVGAHVAVPDGDAAQGAEEDRQLDVEDVCAVTVKCTALQEDFPTVLIPSGPVHDQVDFGFGPGPREIPSEDGDNV